MQVLNTAYLHFIDPPGYAQYSCVDGKSNMHGAKKCFYDD